MTPSDETNATSELSGTPAEPRHAAEPLELLMATTALAGTSADDDADGQLALRNLERRRAEKRRKKRIKIIVACALVVGLIAVVVGQRILAGMAPEEEHVPETAVVERTDFQNVISASGALKAGSTVIVTPEVDGIIEDVRVSEGQEVKEGDLLFTLKNDSLDKAVRDAGQEVQSAQQGLASAQDSVSSAEAARDDAWCRYNQAWSEADQAHKEWEYLSKNYDKLHTKWQNQKNIAEGKKKTSIEPVAPEAPDRPTSPDDDAHKSEWNTYRSQKADYDKLYAKYVENKAAWDAYQAALPKEDEPQPAGEEPTYPEAPDDVSLVSAIDSARDGVTSASMTLQKAKEAYDEAVATADKRKVKAPSSGNVVAVGAKVGAAVGGAAGGTSDTSSAVPLVQISDVNKMTVNIEVNEIDILSIEKGLWAKVTFSALPDVELDAQVQEVATVATGASGEADGDGGGIVTFHVGLVIPHPDPALRPGMTASVKIYTVDIKDALVVPATALTEGEDGTTVEVVTDEETLATETRPVKVGARNASEAVIEEGLSEGDTLLLVGGAAAEEFADASSEELG
ncbi:MAG: biotin/lipoyl-binding protein [Acidobacteriota bacterium]|nr:biotin/lipoyl-binding protein [Acidobacteriota bacterium]